MAPTIFEKLDIFTVDNRPSGSTSSPMRCCAFKKMRCTRQTTRRFDSLNKEILELYAQNTVSAKKQQAVQHFLNSVQLKLHFNEHFGPKTKIEIFGSMANGMASEASDLDIAITVGDDRDYDKERKVFLLENMLPTLESIGCTEVDAILSARVPIIKCKWTDNITKIELEIDISIFNPLAVRNTALLRQYCSWDVRLPQLAFYLKKFAKDSEISGANKRFLSSYALVVMLIKYLHEVEVLPVIQEDFRTEVDHPVMAEGFDCYFAAKVIPNWSRNKSNVAELFYGFLEFYSDYNYDYIIKIDQRRVCTSYRRFWDSPIAVQDPFMFRTNVAHMVGGYNKHRIVKAFQNKAQALRSECHAARAPMMSKESTTNQPKRADERKRRGQCPIEILMGKVSPPPKPTSNY